MVNPSPNKRFELLMQIQTRGFPFVVMVKLLRLTPEDKLWVEGVCMRGREGGYLSSRLVYKPDDRFHVFKKIRPYNSVTKVNQNNYTNLSLLFNILSTIFRFLLINFSTYLQSFRLECFGLMFANTIRTCEVMGRD